MNGEWISWDNISRDNIIHEANIASPQVFYKCLIFITEAL